MKLFRKRETTMPLQYPAEWKFDGYPLALPDDAHDDFCELISMIAEGTGKPKTVYEDFKHSFGNVVASSDTSWAESDMHTAMSRMQENAARYVAAYYSGVESAKNRGLEVPTVERMNAVLKEHDVPLIIAPPNLLPKQGDIEFVAEQAESEISAAGYVRGPEIGRGGFGTVYRITRQTEIGDYHFAMKVFDPSVFIENRERANRRFSREMRALHRVQHRGIVPLLESGLDSEQTPYILMPLIEGKDIKEALAGADAIDIYNAFDEILRALDFAHNNGVAHRDLKPSNILVRTSDKQPFILDFGCAFLIDEVDDSLTTTLIGTSAYIPIEVHQNPKHRDCRQDVYACGVLLYQVVAGELPRYDDYKPIEDIFDNFIGIDKVIKPALAPESRRTASAMLMREQLADLR